MPALVQAGRSWKCGTPRPPCLYEAGEPAERFPVGPGLGAQGARFGLPRFAVGAGFLMKPVTLFLPRFKAGAIFGPQPDASACRASRSARALGVYGLAVGASLGAVGARFDTDAVGAGDVEAGQREADGHDGDGFG